MALLYKMTKSLKMHHHLVHLLTKIGCKVSSILFTINRLRGFCAGPVPGCDICKLLELCIFHNNSLSRCTLCRANPADLQTQRKFAVLAQHADDLPEGSSSCLVLIDTEFHSRIHTQPIERIRTPIYAPQRISSQGLLRAMHLSEYSRYIRFVCIIWHNHVRISLESHALITLQPGDYIRIALSPPDDDFGPDITARNVACCLQLGIPPEEIFEMIDLFGLDEHLDTVPNPNRVINASDWISNDSAYDSVSFSSDDETSLLHLENVSKGRTCSFTDFFLNAVRLYNQANEALPEFPDAEGDIGTYAPWVQDVFEAWQGGATIGPGGIELLARLETWFTDHENYQRCFHSRVAILANDFVNWEAQIRHLWRERLVIGAPLEFYMVSPLPEDADGQAIGQLMIVQRPHRFDRSLVVSVYDSAYDQGRAHSLALVAGDRVDLYSIRLMANAVEDCPPEVQETPVRFGSELVVSRNMNVHLLATDMLFVYTSNEQHPNKRVLRPRCSHPLHSAFHQHLMLV